MTDTSLQSVPAAPGRIPLAGHLWALWREPLGFLRSLADVGELVRVDLGPMPVYVVTTPVLQQQMLTTHAASFARGRIYDRARSLFGNGLATSDGGYHLRQRRLVQPAFHRTRIAGYAEVMSGHTRELASSWRVGQVVAVDRAMHELTLRIAVDALFAGGLDPATSGEIHGLVPAIMAGIPVRMATPARLDRWPIVPANGRFDTAARRLRTLVDGLVAARRRDHDPGSGDLLALLLDARDADTGEAMTDTQVCDEVISLLLAGTETPGTTLSWAFHELARHPEAEARLHAEVDATVGTGPVGLGDVARLEYTARVVQEVLRLHPTLLFTRRATSSVVLGGVHLPAGTEVAYSPYVLHRDPRTYPRPNDFDPDRWLPGGTGPSHETFIPFGAGRHKCLGEAFGWTEMMIAVAGVAARWRLRVADGHVVREVPAEVPRPDALPMTVLPR